MENKELNLSEKIEHFGIKEGKEGYIWEDDVKEFIKRLKKEFRKERYFSLDKTSWIEITKFIDKLAGEELI